MKIAIMQSYFLPYIGYYQLIASVDTFVVYDNIKYTKKGWINRNRMLLNGTDSVFSLPLKNSDALDVVQRELSADYDRTKLLNKFLGAYRGEPFFAQTFPLLERVVRFEDNNLFLHIHNSVVETYTHLGIGTKIRISSDVDIGHELRGQNKVIALTKALCADMISTRSGVSTYTN